LILFKQPLSEEVADGGVPGVAFAAEITADIDVVKQELLL
jgi:hypothetical protein